jgi:hypothetical protein
MITITDALVAEHRVFADLFDHIDNSLPNLGTLAEVRLLITLLELLLGSHAEAERDLAYVALDHMLKEKGRVDRLHQDHREIDQRLRRARKATDVEEARRLLKASITASREHFRREERTVFPLLESALQPDTLVALGTARIHARAAAGSRP